MRRALARLPLLLLPVFAMVGACSASPTDESSSADEADVREGGVCSTLDYGHARSNEEHFLRFASDDDAATYATSFLAAVGKPPFETISHDARLTKLVDEVYAGFKKVFPRETAGFDEAPRIVIVKSDDVNAFAGFDDRAEVLKAPWLFFVHSSILERSFDDSQLRGLFIHELAHLVLRNTLQETRAKIRVHYRGKTIGNAADDDAAVRARVEELRTLGEKVGRFPALGGLPLGVFGTTEYQGALGWFRSQRDSTTAPEACAASDAAFGKLMPMINGHASLDTYSLPLEAAERDEIRGLVAETRAAMTKCYAHVKGSVLEVKVRASLAGAPAEQAEPIIAKILDPSTPEHAAAVSELLPDPIERADLDAKTEQPAIERVLGVVEKLHTRMAQLEDDSKNPIDDLRVFDFEEDADDAAVRVLRAIGDDPLANGKFLLTLLKSDPAACVRDVEAGKEPAYGRFVDPHNGTCWRYWHAVQLSKALAACDAARKQTPRNAKGTGEKSAADKAPTELLEKGR